MTRIVIPGDDPTQIGDSPRLEQLREVAEVILFDSPVEDDAEKLVRVGDADVLINSRGFVNWPGEVLRQLPKLKLITTCSIGTDMIDLAAARECGIVVSNVPGKTAPVVAEHAIALLFAVAKRAAYQTAELKAGRWTKQMNVLLAGKTLGVIGTGAIGAATIKLAKALGMHVVAWTFNPTDQRAKELGVKYVQLDELLHTSDAVSLHVKLTDDSRKLIGAHELQQMKPGALLVNTARGAVVDTPALIAALDSGQLAGAALDVFETEPLPADDPLLTCENIVLTPHHADHTPEGIDLLNQGAVENVLAFLRGEPQNVVT